MNKIKKKFYEIKLLLRSVPPLLLSLFVMALFAMNLLANKSIDLPFEWLALDCGIIVSWFIFLAMDTLTKHFGPKAATEISIIATLINLLGCIILFLGSAISGTWGATYSYGGSLAVNGALDRTFGGTWYVIFGSTAAFLLSAAVNNFSNFAVGRLCRKNPDGAFSYMLRAYVSTSLGQFVDNLVFSLIVSHVFFDWTLTQCVTCALAGMVAELIFEIIFSPIGYKICRYLSKNNIGEEYLSYISAQKNS